MYGGHVVDNLDRRYVSSCLDNLMQDSLLEEKELFPYIEGKGITFKSPQPTTYDKYLEYIQVECPGETPLAFGMHPNAEIDFRTKQCIYLFSLLNELAPKDAAGGDGEIVDPV
jgi:dynein heavy chain